MYLLHINEAHFIIFSQKYIYLFVKNVFNRNLKCNIINKTNKI